MKKLVSKILLIALIAAVTITNMKGYSSSSESLTVSVNQSKKIYAIQADQDIKHSVKEASLADKQALVLGATKVVGGSWLVYVMQAYQYATQIITTPRVAATETVSMSKLD